MDPRVSVDDHVVPWGNFAEFFLARNDGTASFLVELDHDTGSRREWTVGQWKSWVVRTSTWLSNHGVRPRDAVAGIAGNTAESLVIAYACWFMGACYLPLNPADGDSRLAYILRDSAARALVTSPVHQVRASNVAAQCEVELSSFVTTDLPSYTAAIPTDLAARDAQPPAALVLDMPALRVYTSGTTGDPKGVVLTAENLLVDADALAQATGWTRQTRVLTVLPIHHVNGLVISSLLPWYISASTVLCDRFRTEEFWSDAARESATVSSLVPTILEFLLRAPEPVPGCFQEVLCGAGPLLVETVLDFEETFRLPVRHLYGLSETTAVVTLMPEMDDDVRRYWHRAFGFPSIGSALPHCEVTILAEGVKEVPPGVRGEIGIRGRTVMVGYAGQEWVTDDAFRGGWFHSGDEGFWQPGEGGRRYFFITGRTKELIIRGGVNISPLEVDEVLRRHPGIRYALTVPFENKTYGEEIAAYVVADERLTEADVLAHCLKFLDYSKCPKVVVFGNDVPYTATGKAKRLELKHRLQPQLTRYRDKTFRRPAAATLRELSAATRQTLDQGTL